MSQAKHKEMSDIKDLVLDIPLIRGGKEYFTNKKVFPLMLDSYQITYSQAPEVIINQSIRDAKAKGYELLSNMSIEELLDIYVEASRLIIENRGFGSHTDISFDDTLKLVTSSTGMPIHYVKNAFMMFSQAMNNIYTILEVLSPNFSISAYDTTEAYKGDFLYGWVRRGKNLAIVAPSNHPGVNTVWANMSAMKFPALIRPSEKEGLLSYRFVHALYEAGLPEHSLFYLPMERHFVDSFLRNSDLGIIFGNEETVNRYQKHGTIKTYGPGRSKLILDEDYANERDLSQISDFIIGSTLFDGGRSCINASSLLVVGKNSEKLAEEL
ncbi:MAG: aldehyde dehydrogenase family protein, partial [Candidatus Hodarchaeota archaeon]